MKRLLLSSLFSFCVAIASAACGGAVEGPPLDPADPEVIPTGVYELEVGVASCSVNDTFRSGARIPLFRKGIGLNVALPTRADVPVGAAVLTSAPRRDFNLAAGAEAWTMKSLSLCSSATVTQSLTLTALQSTSLSFTYSEAYNGCDLPTKTCDVTFSLRLVDRACTPAKDPACKPQTVDVPTGSSAITHWKCACE